MYFGQEEKMVLNWRTGNALYCHYATTNLGQEIPATQRQNTYIISQGSSNWWVVGHQLEEHRPISLSGAGKGRKQQYDPQDLAAVLAGGGGPKPIF